LRCAWAAVAVRVSAVITARKRIVLFIDVTPEVG
jgi:hypothetical protein